MSFLVRLIFRALSALPLPVLHALGGVWGWLTFLLSVRYRRRLLAHVRQAGYPRSVAFAAVAEAGRMVAEIPRLWLGKPVPTRWEGEAHIREAHRTGKGVVFLTPHLGCFEVAAQLYATSYGAAHPMTVLFRPSRQPWLQDLVAGARQRPGLRTAPTTLGGVKQLIKALRSGETVGLLPDQVPPSGQGVWAPFFGRPAYTMTLSARLLQSAQSCLLFAWGERLPAGRGYVVHVRPLEALLEVPLANDETSAAGQINRAMERLIAECPAQYLWSYNRYKPPG